MISSGYCKVSKDILTNLSKKQAIRFIEEMRDFGGRISHQEWKRWRNWIEDNK